MDEVVELQRQLIQRQNADGGWGYLNASSWTEPTALALLAFESLGRKASEYDRGTVWLAQAQRPDGGWPPQPSVHVSTWVTSLATLALSGLNRHSAACDRGTEWLIQQIKPANNPLERLVPRVFGLAPQILPAGGSPWFPGTAAWIAPTAMSILAFREAARSNSEKYNKLVEDAQLYILSRRCRDGGWNHGGARYRSENAVSYPETTGIALLALHGVPAPNLALPLKRAESFLRSSRSSEASSWLRLALKSHGRDTDAGPNDLPCRTAREISLRLLALAAGGYQKLLSL